MGELDVGDIRQQGGGEMRAGAHSAGAVGEAARVFAGGVDEVRE
jgi:hypothetical protein